MEDGGSLKGGAPGTRGGSSEAAARAVYLGVTRGERKGRYEDGRGEDEGAFARTPSEARRSSPL
jgi:hypothetical protein